MSFLRKLFLMPFAGVLLIVLAPAMLAAVFILPVLMVFAERKEGDQ